MLSRNFRIILVETVNQNVKRELEQRQVQPDTDVLSFPRFPIWICSAMVSFNVPKLSQPLSKPYLTSSSYSFVTHHRAPHPTEKFHLVQYLSPLPTPPFPIAQPPSSYPSTPTPSVSGPLRRSSPQALPFPIPNPTFTKSHPHPLTTTTHPFSLLPLPFPPPPLSSPSTPPHPTPLPYLLSPPENPITFSPILRLRVVGFFSLGLVGLGDSGVGRRCGCVEDESEGGWWLLRGLRGLKVW